MINELSKETYQKLINATNGVSFLNAPIDEMHARSEDAQFKITQLESDSGADQNEINKLRFQKGQYDIAAQELEDRQGILFNALSGVKLT